METQDKEISINGVVYVPKSEAETSKINTGGYVIVRTYSAGVFAGNLVERKEREVKLINARRLWFWSGAATLSQLAMEGVANPEKCKFPCEVAEITLLDCLEIIPCTDKAIKSIKGVKIWEV